MASLVSAPNFDTGENKPRLFSGRFRLDDKSRCLTKPIDISESLMTATHTRQKPVWLPSGCYIGSSSIISDQSTRSPRHTTTRAERRAVLHPSPVRREPSDHFDRGERGLSLIPRACGARWLAPARPDGRGRGL